MWWYVHAGQGKATDWRLRGSFAHIKRATTSRASLQHNSEPVRVVQLCHSKLFASFNLLYKGGNLIAELGGMGESGMLPYQKKA